MTEEKKKRGFAAMDRKLVSAIARLGGKAAHAQGTAHEFTSEEARVAGAKGVATSSANRERRLALGQSDSPLGTEPGSDAAAPAADAGT